MRACEEGVLSLVLACYYQLSGKLVDGRQSLGDSSDLCPHPSLATTCKSYFWDLS